MARAKLTAVLLISVVAIFVDNVNSFSIVRNRSIRSRSTSVLSMSSDSIDLSSVRIMVNGMPGPMATAAAEACLRKGLKLTPVAITGPDIAPTTITVVDPDTNRSQNVRLVPSNDTAEIDAAVLGGLRTASTGGPLDLLAIDYTHPSAVNANGRFYATNGIPFVMGTTGGDRALLHEEVSAAGCSAVIAPNMGKQIVAMQAALEQLAQSYPGAFEGYTLAVTESHQATKADTSGTAKAVIGDLLTLSQDQAFQTESDVKMLRTDEDSLAFGVQEEHLKGHAFHTYTLTSSDGSVQFALQHNVSGRRVYAEGTADAVKFLAKKIRTTDVPQIYTMVNVLEEGALD